MAYETLDIERQGSVVRLYLNRPEARNAMNRQMVLDLLAFFTAIREDRSLRVVVLGARGSAFCAGGDVNELRQTMAASREAELLDVSRFDEMLLAISHAPQVVIAQVQGAAMGGGLGLVCVADMSAAATEATLAFPEVRLGLVPAVISPYVVARIGPARARELMLRGVRLNGAEAAAAGLVTTHCPQAELAATVNKLVNELLQASPSALAAGKALLQEVSYKSLDETIGYRVDLLRQLRGSPEGQEGMMAFLQKRPPGWVETI